MAQGWVESSDAEPINGMGIARRGWQAALSLHQKDPGYAEGWLFDAHKQLPSISPAVVKNPTKKF